MERLSFQDEIVRNKRNSILLISSVIFITVALVFSVSYIFASEYILVLLPVTLIFMLIYAYGSYMYGDQIVLSSTGAQQADDREHLHLRNVVEGLSLAVGIPAPKVYVMPNNELNAYATGRDPEHASIAVTSGLIKTLDRQELEGVIAHELSHIKNRDIMFMTLVAILVGLTAILSHIILRTYRWSGVRGRRDRDSRGIQMIIILVGFILAIFAPLVTRIVQFAISRRREYLADSSAVELTRYPDGLADALEKIKNHNRGEMEVSEAMSHLFLVDPNRSALDSLYATHPPIDERIKRLRLM